MAISPYIKRLRASIGSDLLFMPSVAAIIHDSDDRLLLVRDLASGTWSLPAGAIEPGEDPRRAVEREVREETGYSVQVTELLDALGGPGFRHTYSNGDRTEYMVVVFRCEIIGPTVQPDGGEISEARFFSRTDAPRLAMPFPSKLLWGA